jgi:hypothetical protein
MSAALTAEEQHAPTLRPPPGLYAEIATFRWVGGSCQIVGVVAGQSVSHFRASDAFDRTVVLPPMALDRAHRELVAASRELWPELMGGAA